MKTKLIKHNCDNWIVKSEVDFRIRTLAELAGHPGIFHILFYETCTSHLTYYFSRTTLSGSRHVRGETA